MRLIPAQVTSFLLLHDVLFGPNDGGCTLLQRLISVGLHSVAPQKITHTIITAVYLKPNEVQFLQYCLVY
jgi:hypothetical protein